MAKIRITQKKSSIGATQRQKATLQALRLRKIDSVAEHTENEQINGMVKKSFTSCECRESKINIPEIINDGFK